jgi:hypothetical protein
LAKVRAIALLHFLQTDRSNVPCLNLITASGSSASDMIVLSRAALPAKPACSSLWRCIKLLPRLAGPDTSGFPISRRN